MVWQKKVFPLLFVVLLVFAMVDYCFNNGSLYQMVAEVSQMEKIYNLRSESGVVKQTWCRDNRYDDSNVEKYEGHKIPKKFLENLPSPKQERKCGENGSLLPWRLDGDAWMIFIVKSSRTNAKLRGVIRRTWGSKSELGGKKFGFVFVVGSSDGDRSSLEEESLIHGDILECDVKETYRNLPIKVIASLSWMTKQRHVRPKFVSVTDDDCVINRRGILEAFEREERTEDGNTIYCGFQYDENALPVRNEEEKWFLSEEIYPEKTYPTFCHGGLWTVTPKIMGRIACAYYFTNTEGFYLEDVLLTGVLRQKVNGNIKGLDWDRAVHVSALVYHSGARGSPVRFMLNKWKQWQ